MTRTIKSSRIMVINTVLMLVFLAVLIVQNLYFLKQSNLTESKIETVYYRKLDVIMSMSRVVRQRSLHMLTMYMTDDTWKRDDIFIRFHKLRLVFMRLHQELKSLGLAENEKALFDKVSKIINHTEIIQNDIVERLQSGGDSTVHSDISDKDLPLEYEVLGDFDLLVEIIRQNTVKARTKATEQYRKSISLVAFVAVVIFVGVLFLMKRSMRQIHRIETHLIDEAETLSWDATHDALTNVYNRRWLHHKYDGLQEHMDKSLSHSLLYIDLDEFKPVNDNYGHVVGDQFLCGITRELEKCIRHNDTLARMGGDEFAILLENCDIDKASEIADCLIRRVDKFRLQVEARKISIVGCSIGIHEFKPGEIPFDQLIREADSACYEAKKNGKNQSQVYTS